MKATRHVLAALFDEAIAHGRAWRDAADAADAADLAIGGKAVALLSDADATTRTIEFRGYRYERTPSEVSGSTWIRYDEAAPEIWRVPLRDHLVPTLTVKAPGAGYVIPGGYAPLVADRLARHGLRAQPVAEGAALDAQVWRIDGAPLGKTFEGRTTLTVTGGWAREPRRAGRGAIFVPVAQPGARLVLHLLEPSAPDSLAAWGFFNAALETKEYMEAYVAEEVARAMLADPATRAAFDEALRDPAFAASPARRLEWFFRRSPAWDERVGLLPVYRVDSAPPRPASEEFGESAATPPRDAADPHASRAVAHAVRSARLEYSQSLRRDPSASQFTREGREDRTAECLIPGSA